MKAVWEKKTKQLSLENDVQKKEKSKVVLNHEWMQGVS